MVYSFNLGIGWASSGVEYAQAYRARAFRALGVPARFAGYHYLLYGVELARRNPQYLNRLTTELYPLIAECFGKRPANVERSIRYVVDMAFSSNSSFALSNCLNVDEYQLTQRLTNRAFMTLLVNAKLPE